MDANKESMIIIQGQFDMHSEDIESAKELARALTRETVREDGCSHYAFATDLIHPNRLQLSECWRDDTALARHLETPHIKSFRSGMGKLRVEARVVKRYEIASATDLAQH